MKKSRWIARTALSLSLVSFCSLAHAGNAKQDSLNEQNGIASYFSDKFHGKRTASGERYDKNDLTAAHATLPFGTLIRVVNLKNNQSVDVRVNSRPHRSNKRLLDLSRRGAQELGFLLAGVTKVKMTVLRMGEA